MQKQHTKFRINKIAILGSGLMGSSLACHFAGCGFEVLLLDLASEGKNRNIVAAAALEKSLALKPSNIYHKSFAENIQKGNFDDDLALLQSCDWIIEAVIENLEIKKSLYTKIEKYLNPNSIISSNTSGIPIADLIKGRSETFKQQFLGTHFFNPPRYLKLVEIIPSKYTKIEVILAIEHICHQFLGKQSIRCKDTPAFIANRIGVVSMAYIFQQTESLGISISDADKLTGKALDRPKTGTFRLADLVGLDTAFQVFQDLKLKCPDDRLLQKIKFPKYFNHLIENKYFGNKSGRGFYFKQHSTDPSSKAIFLTYNLNNGEYENASSENYESLQLAKQLDDFPKRIHAILKCDDAGAKLIHDSLAFLFAYSSQRIPEIADDIYLIDQAMKNGFGWDYGPFEYWDLIGLQKGIDMILSIGEELAPWVLKMQANNLDSFYKKHEEQILFYSTVHGTYELQINQEKQIQFNLLKKEKTVFENDEMRLHDINDGVLALEFISKHNTIGAGIINGISQSIDLAESEGWNGIVIGNNAKNFSVGANLMLIGMYAFQQSYIELEEAIRLFQQTSMRLRYSSVPIVAATQGYVFGGGTEFLMHCDASIVSAESYLGLIEVAIGLIPGGGGTKEFALRLSDEIKAGEIIIPQLIEKFKTLATGQVAYSAFEAFDYSYLIKGRDVVCLGYNTYLHQAKQKVLSLAERYIRPVPRKSIYVLGQGGLATLYTAANSMWRSGFASEHDIKIAKKIAYVLCGGDLSYPQKVSEEYLLDLEREAFLSLCTEPKTLERIQFMLENNKALRN